MSQQTVKVVVRVRPTLQKQIAKKNQQFLSFDLNEQQIILDVQSGQHKNRKIFGFDQIFTQECHQAEIFEKTGKKLVEDVVEGYNGTIFAYGQTGSGKTYTMMGNSKNQNQRGIIPRCFQYVLAKAKQNSNRDFLIMCSFIEIYNQEIRDLLNPAGSKSKLQLRQSPEQGVFIKDVKKMAITTQLQMTKYLKMGAQNRATAQTLMNSQSSRSHSIFTIYVQSLEKKSDGTEQLVGSKFNLVDLAGSERQSKTGSSGDRFIQATKINLSLTALGKVITSLVQGKNAFIPYRDSKLTRLLQDSLGGNAKTIMIAAVSPLFSSYDQTVSTLKYASKAKYITNAPIVNLDPKDALLLQYQKQIKNLRFQLEGIQTQPPSTIPSLTSISLLKEQHIKQQKQAEQQKQSLLQKIKQLQQQFISPSQLELTQQKLLSEKKKRQQKLSYMETNYINLQHEVKQMRDMLVELRRKYKNASKQIFQLENQHEKETHEIHTRNQQLEKENIVYKSVLNILFTNKQLNHIISLGNWQAAQQSSCEFKLPTFYFKDRHTLAFPCGENEQDGNQSQSNNNTFRDNYNYNVNTRQNTRDQNRKVYSKDVAHRTSNTNTSTFTNGFKSGTAVNRIYANKRR